MEILTGRQMRSVDARAMRELGIPSERLMESAGRGVAESLVEEVRDLASREVVLACGKGNNGGDGLVAARHLRRLGVAAAVRLVADGPLSADAARELARAREAGCPVEEIGDEGAWSRAFGALDRDAVVVDALLGTGVRGGARGLISRTIEWISDSGGTVVAVDLPSGADADSGRLEGPVVRAHRTYTLCRPKPCLVLEPAASHAGTWTVIDIGIPDAAVAAERAELAWLDEAGAAALYVPRSPDAHKGAMGRLLVFAGSRGKSGAAVLAGRAALRAGAGLVTVATPRSVQAVVAGAQAELMTEGLSETRAGSASRAAAGAVLALARDRTALAIGPGLGTAAETRAAALAVLDRAAIPCVVDADGLNALAARRGRRPRAQAPPRVLTPHPGEAARCLRTSAADVQADRLGSARRLAEEYASIVVLKGRRSIVAHPDGRGSINASGNPGLATGGTGDALTGIIGALLARGLDAFDAARLGTYVHGAAGDRAAAARGVDGLVAGDVIDALPDVWTILAGRRGVSRWT